MCRLSMKTCIVCWWALVSSHCIAMQVIEKEALVTKTQKVQLIDEDGKPIAGASVKPFGLNTSYFWPDNLMGKPKAAVTDKDGIVSLDYPELFADGVSSKSIDCVVGHTDYVGSISRIPINEIERQTVKLSKGIRFGIKAIEPDGSTARGRFTAFMSGEAAPLFRLVGAEGLIETKGAAIGPHLLMLVQPMKDNKTRFSEALFFHFNDRDLEMGVVVDDVELLPGVRIYGKLPSSVKRPVKDGVVLARQQPLPMDDASKLVLRPLMWGEWTTVAEDGSFEFVSMPRTGKIQIIAMCDGWVSTGERMMTKGQTFIVSEKDLEIELDLQPTMDGIIDVKDEMGNPIQDAVVAFWPNQLWEGFGSQILGQRNQSLDQAKAQTEQIETSYIMDRINAFVGKTDVKGRVVIPNLPARFALPFSIEKKGFAILEQSLPGTSEPGEPPAGSSKRLTSQISVTLKKAE